MPVLKPPKPGGNKTGATSGEWTLILKDGETVNIEYEKK
jgi:hypothetical protein